MNFPLFFFVKKQVSSINRVLRNLGSKSLDSMSSHHDTYCSVDNKLRVLHGQSWPSSSAPSSFYVHQPGSSVYSNSGDSNSEYKHQTNETNQELGGKSKQTMTNSLSHRCSKRPPVDILIGLIERIISKLNG